MSGAMQRAARGAGRPPSTDNGHPTTGTRQPTAGNRPSPRAATAGKPRTDNRQPTTDNRRSTQPMQKILFLFALCLTLAAPAIAQVQSGTIAGIVRDEQGGVLPGVTVTLTGADRSATFVTEADGRFRFLDLPPGVYKVTSELQGFSKMIREGITVTVGSNVDIPVVMKVASLQGSLTVTGDSPIVDTKAMGTATNFTSAELEKIPTSRDPWALLRTVPGVMVDRVNIAGNETGQQSNFQSN